LTRPKGIQYNEQGITPLKSVVAVLVIAVVFDFSPPMTRLCGTPGSSFTASIFKPLP
jgi:hypothetical protein